MSQSSSQPPARSSLVAWIDRYPLVAVAAFAAVVGLFAFRAVERLNVPGSPDPRHWAMQDFRDAVYYPVVAFVEGVNPYDTPRYRAAYPVGAEFPPYSPLALLVYLPFGFVPYTMAEAAYFGCCVAMVVLLAYAVLRFCGLGVTTGRVFALAALVQLTRPGYANLLVGQVGLQVVLGCLVALHFAKRRPWIAGLGLGLATLKPTFGVPLALVMLCRRDVRAVLWGMACGGVGAAIAVALLVWRCGGWSAFLAAIPQSYGAFASDSAASPVTGTMRCDALAVLARLLSWNPGPVGEVAVAMVVWAVCGVTVARLSRWGGASRADDLSGVIACLAVLVSVYHLAYDALLLALPLVAVAVARREPWPGVSTKLRAVLVAALAVPCLNYLGTYEVLSRLGIEQGHPAWNAITAANGLGLLAALAVCLGLAIHRNGGTNA